MLSFFSTAEEVRPLRVVITRNYQHHILEYNFINNHRNKYSLQRVATYIHSHRSDSSSRIFAINIGNNPSREYRTATVKHNIFEVADSIVQFDRIDQLPDDVTELLNSHATKKAISQLDSSDFHHRFLVIRKFGKDTSMTYLSAEDYSAARGFDKIYDIVKSFITQNVSAVDSTISARSTLEGSTDFLHTAHRFQLTAADADISISAANSLDDTLTTKSKIRDILKLFPYDNKLVTFSLTEEQLLKLLSKSANEIYQQMFSINDDLIRATPEGHLQRTIHNIYNIGGLFWSIDARRKGLAVKIDSLAGEKTTSSDKVYTIATDSFRAEKIITSLGLSIPIRVVAEDWIYSYIKWLNENVDSTTKSSTGRLTIKPQRWSNRALRREINIIEDRQNHRQHQRRSSLL